MPSKMSARYLQESLSEVFVAEMWKKTKTNRNTKESENTQPYQHLGRSTATNLDLYTQNKRNMAKNIMRPFQLQHAMTRCAPTHPLHRNSLAKWILMSPWICASVLRPCVLLLPITLSYFLRIGWRNKERLSLSFQGCCSKQKFWSFDSVVQKLSVWSSLLHIREGKTFKDGTQALVKLFWMLSIFCLKQRKNAAKRWCWQNRNRTGCCVWFFSHHISGTLRPMRTTNHSSREGTILKGSRLTQGFFCVTLTTRKERQKMSNPHSTYFQSLNAARSCLATQKIVHFLLEARGPLISRLSSRLRFSAKMCPAGGVFGQIFEFGSPGTPDKFPGSVPAGWTFIPLWEMGPEMTQRTTRKSPCHVPHLMMRSKGFPTVRHTWSLHQMSPKKCARWIR